MTYKFLGKPDSKYPWLVTGRIYDLTVQEKSNGILGWMVGNTRPYVKNPLYCPYSSWETFYKNWEIYEHN